MYETLLHFHGTSFRYTVVATRGHDLLGLHLMYAQSKSGPVSLLGFRFAALNLNKPLKEFKHFTARDVAEFTFNNVTVSGVKLNRFALPFLKNKVGPIPVLQVRELGTQLGVWPQLSAWLQTHIEAEGFTPLIFDMTAFLQNYFPDGSKTTLALDVAGLGTTLPVEKGTGTQDTSLQ